MHEESIVTPLLSIPRGTEQCNLEGSRQRKRTWRLEGLGHIKLCKEASKVRASERAAKKKNKLTCCNFSSLSRSHKQKEESARESNSQQRETEQRRSETQTQVHRTCFKAEFFSAFTRSDASESSAFCFSLAKICASSLDPAVASWTRPLSPLRKK